MEKNNHHFSLLFFSFVFSSAALGIFSLSPAHPQMTQMFADNIRMATWLRLSAKSADYYTIHSSLSGLGFIGNKCIQGDILERMALMGAGERRLIQLPLFKIWQSRG